MDAEPFRRAQFVEDLLQPVALGAVLDLARDAGRVDARHEDEEAARQREIGADGRRLAGERLAHDLGQDLLPGVEVLADPARLAAIAAAGQQPEVDLVQRQEAVQIGGDLDERRLEGGQDRFHHRVVDIALEAGAVDGLDLVVGEHAAVDNRHP
jgi:hypothetical protein